MGRTVSLSRTWFSYLLYAFQLTALVLVLVFVVPALEYPINLFLGGLFAAVVLASIVALWRRGTGQDEGSRLGTVKTSPTTRSRILDKSPARGTKSRSTTSKVEQRGVNTQRCEGRSAAHEQHLRRSVWRLRRIPLLRLDTPHYLSRNNRHHTGND